MLPLSDPSSVVISTSEYSQESFSVVKHLCDYIEPTHIIKDNLLISRSFT